MGLDMWLNRKKYVDTLERKKIKITGIKVNKSKVCYIEEECLYWRKAHSIHQWFVSNCQDGNDDCQQVWVSKEQLKELYRICYQIVNETDKAIQLELAKDLLPTHRLPFADATEVDEDYLKDLKYTTDELAKILMLDKITQDDGYDYYYSSSW